MISSALVKRPFNNSYSITIFLQIRLQKSRRNSRVKSRVDTLSSQPNMVFPEPIDRLLGLVSLLRCYLAWRPVIAEHQNASLAAQWAAFAQSGRLNDGREIWIETHDRFGNVTYMFWGLDGGKHSKRPPEGVSEEQILKVFEPDEPSSSL